MVRSRITVGTTPEGDGGLDLRAVEARKGGVHQLDDFRRWCDTCAGRRSSLWVTPVQLVICADSSRVKFLKDIRGFNQFPISGIHEAQANFAMRGSPLADREFQRPKVFGRYIEGGVVTAAYGRAAFRGRWSSRQPHGKSLEFPRVHASGEVVQEDDLTDDRRGYGVEPKACEGGFAGQTFVNGCPNPDINDNRPFVGFGVGFNSHRKPVDRLHRLFGHSQGRLEMAEQMVGLAIRNNFFIEGMGGDGRHQCSVVKRDPSILRQDSRRAKPRKLQRQRKIVRRWGGDSVYNGIAPIRVGPADL